MKKTRAISLLLSLSLICAMLVPGAAAFAENETDSGMKISKTATANDDGSYTITLEAYATGEKVITEVTEDIPTDIVLVLDQSGSMADCLVCGEEITQDWFDSNEHNIYTETTSIDTRSSYYIKNGNTYTEVYYCDGNHGGSYISWPCEGGAGWYTSNWSNDHTDENKITPKTDANPNGTQFYEYKSEACSSRLDALKSAVTTFVNAVSEKAKGGDGKYGTDDDIQHRIAIVGFGSDDRSSYENTELFIGSTQYNYNNNTINAQYGKALQLMNEQTGRQNIAASIDQLTANGGTAIDLGTEMANKVFAAYNDNADRAKVVIVFTDGVPGIYNTDNNSTRTGYANRAINNTYTSKNSYKATVYTVGIFAGADASSPNSLTTSTDWDKDAVANKFMHLMSSNYLTATSMTDTGSLNPNLDGDSYYLSAGSSSTLNNIFEQISKQIESGGSSTTLSEKTVIKDIIAPAFTLPQGATASDITLETYQCTGKNGDAYIWENNNDAMGATAVIGSTDTDDATTTNNQVSVTGFDFAENYVGTVNNNGTVTYRGHKLVISFKVKPRPGFLGGNAVYTNTSAGVYENANAENPVLTFEQPTADVEIGKLEVSNVETNVYLGGYYSVTVPAEQIKAQMTATCGGVTLDLTQENFGLEDWQHKYVDIVVTVKDANENDLTGGIESLTEDVAYTVTITVKPKTEGSATEQSGSGTDTIRVFKPELTFADSEVYYGDTAPTAFDDNLAGTRWVHYDSNGSVDKVADAEGVTMLNAAPTLALTYTPDSTKIADGKINTKQDIAVDVAVKIGDTAVTTHTTFLHTNCAGKNCTVPADKEFLLHVKTCTLNITKKDGAANEPYVFTVKKDGTNYTEVTIVGNGSATIYELPVGTYTIAEDTGWSWRYNADNGNGVTLSKDNVEGRITCTNTLNKPYWLNGFSEVVKNIFNKASN